MLRVAACCLLALAAAMASITVRLFLNDGSYHTVREYEVKQDRVRFFSTERGEWEEIPLDLVDLKRTKAEQSEREEAIRAESAATKAEDRAIREMQREAARVPAEPGVYWINGAELTPVKQAEPKIVNNKRRSILKAISPIPIVAGKSTLEIDGESAALAIANERPEFYIRLASDERFTIVRTIPKKGIRLVETWNFIPVSKELIQEHEDVEIFRHQAEEGLYKIWAQKPMPPGQYAVIEYTEGKGNTRVWDFAVAAPGASSVPATPAPATSNSGSSAARK